MCGYTEGLGECGGPYAEAWDEKTILYTGDLDEVTLQAGSGSWLVSTN